MTDRPKVIVAQLGARMHYAVPRILYESGLLAHLYTDICATKGWPRYLRAVPSRVRPKQLRRLLGRVPHGVPPRLITTFPSLGLKYANGVREATSAAESDRIREVVVAEFGRRIADRGFHDADTLYTFVNESLEVVQAARSSGLRVVLEQTIPPTEIISRLVGAECQVHKEWSDWCGFEPSGRRAHREKLEWKCASMIICGSQFVADGIREAGGPVEKCQVVPYGVSGGFRDQQNASRRDGPLRLLSVGSIGLRKGTPYVLEAAKLVGDRATFRIIGPGASPANLEIPPNVEMLGQIPRTDLAKHYSWADAFLLPALCEGSATVTYEAIVAGLPVLCTPNAGSITRHMEDGIVFPAADSAVIARWIERLSPDQPLLESLTKGVRHRRGDASLQSYRDRLVHTLLQQPNAIASAL